MRGLAVVVTLLAALGCGPSGDGSGAGSKAPAPSGPWLVLTGAHLGELEPCGCAKPKQGGIEQRAVLFAREYADEGVLVDCGDLIARPGRQQELKYAAFLEAMKATGYAAVAVGGRDLMLGVEVLSSTAKAQGVTLLAANLTLADGSRPFEGWVRVPRPGGGALVVVGLLPDGAATPMDEGATVEPAAAALTRVLGEARPAAGEVLVVVGGYDDALARTLEPIATGAGVPALVVHSRGKAPPDTRLDGARLGIGGKGRYVVALTCDPGKPWADPVVHRVQEVETDETMQAVIHAYQQTIADEDLMARVPRSPAAVGFVGSEACASCHKGAHEVWSASRHARAMRSLVAVRHHFDPECVTCHVTGMNVIGGYVSREKTPKLARVTCESCHGPGAAHVAEPKKLNIRRGNAGTCLQCHVKDHDPTFDYDKRWPAIEHR